MKMIFRSCEAESNIIGAKITRTIDWLSQSTGSVLNRGVLDLVLELLDVHPELRTQVPLLQTRSGVEWKAISQTEAIMALMRMITPLVVTPQSSQSIRFILEESLHSGRIAGTTSLAAMGASESQIQRAGRRKSLAFMSYIRAGGGGRVCFKRAC